MAEKIAMCAAPSCPGVRSAHERAAGTLLCRTCRSAIADGLARLPGLHDGCERFLEYRSHHTTGRVSGWWPTGICLNETAVTVRSDMVEILASWCSLVVDERDVDGPDGLTVRELVAYLRRHLDWLCAHPAAVDLAREIAELTGAAEDVIEPDSGLRLELGRCPAPDCGRTVRAIIRENDHQVRCDAGHQWRPHQWLLLGELIEARAARTERPVPAATGQAS